MSRAVRGGSVMEMDTILASWKEQNEKIDACIRLNRQVISETRLSSAQKAMRPLTFELIVQVSVNLLAIALLGFFSWIHWSDPRFLIPAVILDVYVIALNAQLFRQLILVHQIDYNAPVAEIQKRLALISVERVRGTVGTFVSAPAVWTPLLIVGLKGCFGVDAYRTLGAPWLVANLLVCTAVTITASWLLRRNEAKLNAYPALQRLSRDIAGKSLQSAMSRVAEVQSFLAAS